MHENILSKYKRVYSRFPSQLNQVHLWYYKDVETKRNLEHAYKQAKDILRHMESLGIKTHSNDPKPKKSHSGKKAQ
jgi:hypothetical protein